MREPFIFLTKYKDSEGCCNVSRSHKDDGENLGTWLSQQRGAKKKEKLDIIRIQRLDIL